MCNIRDAHLLYTFFLRRGKEGGVTHYFLSIKNEHFYFIFHSNYKRIFNLKNFLITRNSSLKVFDKSIKFVIKFEK